MVPRRRNGRRMIDKEAEKKKGKAISYVSV